MAHEFCTHGALSGITASWIFVNGIDSDSNMGVEFLSRYA